MASAFTIRPFGKKKDSNGNEIDFENVHDKLIQPAINAAELGGGTTLEIIEAGNIREDMFAQICTADVVIADISIHNANVFYELGIRHAVREKRTVLINSGADNVPFDLLTDRYLHYKVDSPEDSLDQLIETLKATIESEKPDSPVFKMIPSLKPQDPTGLIAVPRTFSEAVWDAQQNRAAEKLTELSQQVLEEKKSWMNEGLRLVAEGLFKLKSWKDAAAAWEAVRKFEPIDIEANLRLGTIYAKMSELTASEQALNRIDENNDIQVHQHAELCSLKGSNAKTRWLKEWDDRADVGARQQAALLSPHLSLALEAYEEGFHQDLNHYYSGLNAFALVNIQAQLADMHPDLWEAICDEDDDPEKKLIQLRRQRDKLEAMVESCLDAAIGRNKRAGKKDIWALISVADLKCLISPKELVVLQSYRNALVDADQQSTDAVRRQLEILQKLGLFSDNVQQGLAAVEAKESELSATPA